MSDFITNAELRIEAERLLDDNKELRKLVQDMWPSIKEDVRKSRIMPSEFQKLRDRARALGIEVS